MTAASGLASIRSGAERNPPKGPEMSDSHLSGVDRALGNGYTLGIWVSSDVIASRLRRRTDEAGCEARPTARSPALGCWASSRLRPRSRGTRIEMALSRSRRAGIALVVGTRASVVVEALQILQGRRWVVVTGWADWSHDQWRQHPRPC